MSMWLGLASAVVGAAAAASPLDPTTAEPSRLFQLAPAPASGCVAELGSGGQPVALPTPLDDRVRDGLRAGVHLALQDSTGAGAWPADQIDAAPPCPIARFEADEVVWTMYSGVGRAPPRWIRAAGRDEVLYLARGPALADAEGWHRTRQGPPTALHGTSYYLVGLAAGLHFIFQVYDGAPDIRRLADDAAAVIEGRTPPLAGYDSAAGAVSLLVETRTGSPAEIFAPGHISAERPASLLTSDGSLFAASADGAMVMRGSGFACPARFGAFTRTRVMILNASDETLDLGCRLDFEGSWASIFVTRIPNAAGDKAYFAQRIRHDQASTGVSRRLSDPPTGRKSLVRGGSSWIADSGLAELLLFFRQGEYVIELRMTHTLDHIDEASDVLPRFVEHLAATAE